MKRRKIDLKIRIFLKSYFDNIKYILSVLGTSFPWPCKAGKSTEIIRSTQRLLMHRSISELRWAKNAAAKAAAL